MLEILLKIAQSFWQILLDSSFYILMGMVIAGLLRMVLQPGSVLKHLGHGRYLSVVKAAIFGVPLPLCSCGVLPAAASLRRQGANKGATSAFLIATPESGVDSIAVSYALLDPLLTILRPCAALVSAMAAGLSENLLFWKEEKKREVVVDLRCPVDGCCDGKECPDDIHRNHHSRREKVAAGLRYGFGEVWGDIVGWFFIGLLLAAVITAVIPDEFMARFLGGGLQSMGIMLLAGVPIYICATASTPVAAALILKGVSPGAALVFLLVGPATNITSLSVLRGILGKRSTVLYLAVLSLCAVLFGLLADSLYGWLGISPHAVLGSAAEIVPYWLQLISALILLGISVKPLYNDIMRKLRRYRGGQTYMSDFPALQPEHIHKAKSDEGCSDHCGCNHT